MAQGEKEVGLFTSTIEKPENKIEPSDTHRSDFDAADGDMPASAFADAAELAAKQKPKGTKISRPAMTAIAVAVGLALVGGWAVSRKKEAPPQVSLPKVSHVAKTTGLTLDKPMAPSPVQSEPSVGIVPNVPQVPSVGIAANAPQVPSAVPNAPQADLIDQARQMFLSASQNAVHVASMTQVKPSLFAVAYVVGDMSGQAWVDLTQKVVFIGSAVAPDGALLTPGATVAAMGATKPGATPDAATMHAQNAPGSVQGDGLPPAVSAVLKDRNAGFWEGDAKAPPVWAFVDPDSKESLDFYQRARVLIDSHKIRVFWIPVGIKDSQSMPRAAYILAQVGQAKTLKQNYDGFAMMQSAGGVPSNVITIDMRHRILDNNGLLTDIGQLTTPTAILCVKGALKTFFGPSATMNAYTASACPSNVEGALRQ
jgi:hypothetical protein